MNFLMWSRLKFPDVEQTQLAAGRPLLPLQPQQNYFFYSSIYSRPWSRMSARENEAVVGLTEVKGRI
jgi:hypothetical protein